MNIKIVDNDGKFYRNTSAFRMADALDGTLYDPGVIVKINASTWVAGQPVIEEVADPYASDGSESSEPITKKPKK